MIAKVFALVTLLLSTCVLLNAQQSLNVSDYYKRSMEHFNAGELDAALVAADKVIQLAPNHISGYVLRTMIWNRKDAKADRSDDWNTIIRIGPDDPRIWWIYLERAIYRSRQLNWTSAIEDLDKAIDLERSAFLFSLRSYFHLEKDDLDHARADYNRSLALDATVPSPFVRRGYTLFHKRDFQGAIAAFDTALEWKPDDAMAYAGRGMVLGLQGKLAEAIVDLTKEIAPGATAFSKSICQSHCNCPINDIMEFIKNNPTNARAYEVRGVFSLLMGKNGWAASDFNKAVKLDPGLKSEIQSIENQLRRP
jgi:tetratricopeptide (TPR) repeat protein